MYKVKIIGAGSIGNHLAHASRGKGWAVTLTDQDPAALQRTRESIYPGRYGKWDDAIVLKSSAEAMKDAEDGLADAADLALAHELVEDERILRR